MRLALRALLGAVKKRPGIAAPAVFMTLD